MDANNFTGWVSTSEPDGSVVVSLAGYHDLDTAPRVQRALSEAIDKAKPVVIDLSTTEMLDSTVLGSIITAHTRASNRGQTVVLAVDHESRPVVRNLLRVTGIASSVDIYPTLDDALRAVDSGQTA